MIYLRDYIDKSRILFLNSDSREEALNTLIDHVKDASFIKNFDLFKKAVFDREAIVSTGIGYSVAIPHVKIKEVDEFFIVIGIHQEGVNWDSLDEKPVHLVFLIGGPDNHQQYLKILAKLSLLIKNREIRKKVIDCNTADQVYEIFKSF
jgi:PTS system nitrogen regulatory IIA component